MIKNLVARVDQNGQPTWAASDDVSVYNNVAKINMHGNPTWVGKDDVSIYNRQNTRLQNLAWLGEDGQVHTVNQNSNGGPKMLGATYQPTFQNLAWLGEDNQVHTVN